ncbi:unnamed protein product [Heterobilharzia americana]|nr:unnamed protein product [Heterobilharzia americana]
MKKEEEMQTRRRQKNKLHRDMLTLRTSKYSTVQQKRSNNRRTSASRHITSSYSRSETFSDKDSIEASKSDLDRANHNQMGEKSTSFCLYDWETCSENISQVESKLKQWHYDVDMLYKGKESVGNRVSPLKCCEEINIFKQLLPGKQIFIRTFNSHTNVDVMKQPETVQIPIDITTNDVCKSVRFENDKSKGELSEVSSHQNDTVLEVCNLQTSQVKISTESDNEDDYDIDEECQLEDEKHKETVVYNAIEKIENITNEVKLILGRIRPVSSSYGYVLGNQLNIPLRNTRSARIDENKENESRGSTMTSPKPTVRSYTTAREYRELREQLRKQENEMRRFRVSLLM